MTAILKTGSTWRVWFRDHLMAQVFTDRTAAVLHLMKLEKA